MRFAMCLVVIGVIVTGSVQAAANQADVTIAPRFILSATVDVTGGNNLSHLQSNNVAPNLKIAFSNGNYILTDGAEIMILTQNAVTAGFTLDGTQRIATGPAASISAVTVSSVLNGVVNVTGIPAAGANIRVGTGTTMAVNVGNSGSVQGILGNVTFSNPTGLINLVVDNSADTTGRTTTVTNIANTNVAISGLAPGVIQTVINHTASLAINAGTGVNTLIGPDLFTNWTVSGANAGTFDSGFGFVITFNAMANLTGGTGNDFFTLGSAGTVSGKVDGGAGFDSLDNTAIAGATVTRTGPGTIDGKKGTATGVGSFDNFNDPLIFSISPKGGPLAGGTTVILTGVNFTGVTAVVLQRGTIPFTVDSDTQITCIMPANPARTLDILARNPGVTSRISPADQYTYTPIPTVTSISPASGPTAGATAVTVTGTDLSSTSAVNFGATAASSFTVNSATSLTCTAPAGTVGTVDITVTTLGGTSTTSASDQYTYVKTAQTITFAPASPVTYGIAPITLMGTSTSGLAVTYTLVSGPATLAGSTLTVTGAGSVIVKADQAGDARFSAASSVSATIVVNKAILTVKADNKSKIVGSVNPTLTATISGFVNGDSSAVVSGSAALSTTATTNSPVGVYPITVAIGTLSATNYDLPGSTYANGVLSVTASVNFSSPPSAYPDPAIQDIPVTFTAVPSSATAIVTWDFGDGSLTSPGSTVSHIYTVAGTYTVTVTAQDPGTSGSTTTSFTLLVEDVSLDKSAFLPGTFEIKITQGRIRLYPSLLKLTGTVSFPANTNYSGSSLTLTVNNLTDTFKLNAVGNASGPLGTLHFSHKATKTGETAFRIYLHGGNLGKAVAENAGLDSKGRPKKALIEIQLNGLRGSYITPLNYVTPGYPGLAKFGHK